MSDELRIRPNRRRTWMVIGGVAVVALAIGGWFLVRSLRSHDVVFEAGGSSECVFAGVIVNVGRDGKLLHFDDDKAPAFPWRSKKYSLKHGDHLSLSVTALKCGPLTCRILVDGVEVSGNRKTEQVSCDADVD